jgi:hypothetical protein
MAMPLGLVDDGVDVDGAVRAAASGWTGVDLDIQIGESAKHEAEFGARVAALNLDDPLPADANALCESGLVELELPAPVANNGAEIGGCTYEHGQIQIVGVR